MPTHIEEAFIHHTYQLRKCIQRQDLMDLLSIAVSLRFLLLENSVSKVNKEAKHKFNYMKGPEDNGFIFNFTVKVNDKDIFSYAKHPNITDVLNSGAPFFKLEDFLRYQILAHKGEKYTVRDVVKIVSNKLGGVHVEDMDGDKKVAYLNDLKLLKMGEVNALYDALMTISKITLKALEPLDNSIRQLIKY